MEYNSYLQNCGDDDVISFESHLYKFCQLKLALESAKGQIADVIVQSLESQPYGMQGVNIYQVPNRGSEYKMNWKWLREGKNCEILSIGAKGWRKGKLKLRVSLEFCPDEPEIVELPTNNIEISEVESPLDDIRQMMNGNS